MKGLITMIKRCLAAVLIMVISISTAFAAFDDLESGSEYSQAVERLVQYGILSGKGEGTFDPDAGLTRAEMAKIATIVGGLDGSAASSAGTSLYADLNGSHWASGYVNTAARNQLILGYPNGTFAPEKGLSFSEAVTIVLRLLGYTTDDLGNNWPWAYTAKAAELSLTKGLSYGDYDLISRRDIALIIDRALMTDMNGSSQTAKKLIQLMSYSLTDECIILATSAENKNLLSDDISTTIGTYKKIGDSIDKYVTQKVRLVLNKEGRAVNVIPVVQSGKNITIQSIVGNETAYSENGITSSMKLDDSAVVYYQGVKKTFAEVKSFVEVGMTMAVYYSSSGVYDYAVVKDFELLGPIVISSDFKGDETRVGDYELNKNGLRVIRDGFDASLSDIKAFDVAYYNKASNILQIYCDKVSGVYEKAIPSKAAITSLSLSGVQYSLETQTAARLLGEYPGAYKINDFVTLLLGRDGGIVSVVNTNAEDLTVYGIILGSGERISEDEDKKGTKEYYIKTFTVSGVEQEFTADKDYTEYRGRIIKYQFSNGVLVPQIIPSNKISGNIDLASQTIGNSWISKDTKIIDLLYAPAINETGEAVAKLIDISQILVSSLSQSDVIHAYIDNKFGDIQFIVLDNITLGG